MLSRKVKGRSKEERGKEENHQLEKEGEKKQRTFQGNRKTHMYRANRKTSIEEFGVLKLCRG